MSRPIYCRMCAEPFEQIAGALPERCPACKKPALWSTEPQVKPALRWTHNDKRFLKAIRVEADE